MAFHVMYCGDIRWQYEDMLPCTREANCVYVFLFILGKSFTMIGKDNSTQSLGIIPCAISWLFKLINERKEKTGTRFSIRVSAVEISGKDENLKDLLAEVATGSLQDGQSPGVYLREDPICGTQV